MYYRGSPKVLILGVFAPPSRLALIVGAWFVLQGISKSSEFRVLAPPSRLALIIGAWFVSQRIYKSSEFSGVGSALEVGFDHRGLVCITGDF